jgi:hypothetical protein
MNNHVYNQVMAELAEADELGGVANIVEYVQLMKAISEECLARRDVALTNATIDEIKKIIA